MSDLKPKTVAFSAIQDQTYKAFPNDLNSNGTVFGGLVMALLDRVALVVAERHSERMCVTASVDSIHFLAPARKGDILLFQAAINRSWRSSMEIGIRVRAVSYQKKEDRHILSAYFTFVALDEEGKPTKVPQVIPETPLEKRRYEEAEMRRQHRKKEKEERQLHRQK
jgi:acyl-CoA hydrolase